MAGRLDGKVALITGAASGIGRSCAHRFAEQGAVVMVAGMNGERAEKVVSEILAAGGTADSWVVETSSEASCDEMVGATVKRFDRVDLCVAAAGISHAAYVSREVDEQVHSDRMDKSDALLVNKSVASWQRVLDVNLTGVMLTDRAVARQMIAQGDGGSITRESWVNARLAETPLRRLGEPDDIANACLYLASDEASFVTGEVIYADGGFGAATRS